MTLLIDTHAHLDFPHFAEDFASVLKRAQEAGLKAIVDVGTDEQSSRRAVELSRQYPMISASVGIHPHSAASASQKWLATLEELAELDTVLAIGEAGLDYYRNLSPRDKQEELFRAQIHLACRVDKPIIIHSREAHTRTLQILREEKLPSKVGVMHCFSGEQKMLEAFLDLGFYISLAGPLTYPRSHTLRSLLKYIPGDRLLLETDSPYLPPQAFRGKRNEPSFIKLTYERAAMELDMDLDQFAKQVYLNAVRFYSDTLVDRT
ncbi:MAG: hypothetical protein AVO34_02975 [Firmicutes bacterium ML8_F2]|nr:MAG: hypothetical protein AVO34_02975 [Firmicutes bacterium ML8_F2]